MIETVQRLETASKQFNANFYINFYAGLPCGCLGFECIADAQALLNDLTFDDWKQWFTARIQHNAVNNYQAIMNKKTSVTATIRDTTNGVPLGERVLTSR